MLATDAGKQTLHRFFEQYLDYANVTSMQKPNIASFASVSADMVQETRAFIDQIVFQNGGGLEASADRDHDQPVAGAGHLLRDRQHVHGRLPDPGVSDYASVTRPAAHRHRRAGAGRVPVDARRLGHVVADQARAVHVLQAVLPAAPEPPPNVPPLDTTTVMTGINTTRDRYEKLHAAGSCASCHTQFDPLGFGFEHFDEGGRYRAKEKTFDINSSGTITAPDGTTINFTDEQELMTAVANQPIIHQCMSAYLAAYRLRQRRGVPRRQPGDGAAVGIDRHRRGVRAPGDRAALHAAKQPVTRAQPAGRQPIVRQPAVRTSGLSGCARLSFVQYRRTVRSSSGSSQRLLEVADRVQLAGGLGHVAVGGEHDRRESPPAPATAAGARGTIARP